MNKNFTYLLIVFYAVILFACKNGGEEALKIPENVLSEEKYVKLLVDFSLAESAGNLNLKNLSGLKFDSAYAFSPLKENNVSKEKYDSTISFYSKHPKLYKRIFEEVLTTLSKMQAARNLVIKKDSITKKDSIIKKAALLKKDSLIKKGFLMKKDSVLKKETTNKKDSIAKKAKVKKPKRKKKKKTV